MFTVKQTGLGFEKMWPNITCVDAHGGHEPDAISFVSALCAAGGSLDFRTGTHDQTIYVMNDNGSTVARYFLRGDGKAYVEPLPQGDDLSPAKPLGLAA